jgi:uncharacterized protein YkwD
VAPRSGRRDRRRVTRVSRGLAVLAAALATSAPAGGAPAHVRAHAARGCPNADTSATRASAQVMRNAVLCLVNHQRMSRHLSALHELRRLDRSAQRWTNAMVSSGSFGHGSSPGARISAGGYSWSSVGENIATGYATPRAVVSVWMGSTGHCRNILAPNFTDIGVGVSRRAVSGVASGPATWTEDFGRPMGEAAPSGNWGPADRCPY